MRNNCDRTVLASVLTFVLALLITSPVLGGQEAGKVAPRLDAQAGAEEVGKKAAHAADLTTEEPKIEESKTNHAGAALGQEAPPLDNESTDGESDPPPEPQAVLKTKTKSNQSND